MSFETSTTPSCPDESPMQWPTASEPGSGVSESSPLDAWRKAHQALLAKERAFSRLVRRCAHGQAPPDEVEGARMELLALRELVDVVLQKALGVPQANQGGTAGGTRHDRDPPP
jgi:hypothetical protein